MIIQSFPLEATPSKDWIEGCVLAWALLLESCSYVYMYVCSVLSVCVFMVFVVYQFQTGSSECGSALFGGELDLLCVDRIHRLRVLICLCCFVSMQSSINLADIIKEVGYTATAS